MTAPVFPQTVIAIVWDFDRTLIPGYMQEPLFARFDVDPTRFWDEVNALPDFYRDKGYPLVSADTIYLSHILTYVREGTFAGLNNAMLRECGQGLAFYPGLPDFLPTLQKTIADVPRYAKHDITVEHYVVSTGLRQTILGSSIEEHVDGVWACEFLETVALPGFMEQENGEGEGDDAPKQLTDVGFAIDNTTKTRAIFEINKGVNKHPSDISVNDTMSHDDRRVPFENMIYIADGPSDVPVFSLLNQYSGKTFAVYDPASEPQFRQVLRLLEQRRVQGLGPADYSAGSHTARWLTTWAVDIAERIATRREQVLRDRIGKPPRHLLDDLRAPEAPQDEVGRLPQAPSPEPAVPEGNPASSGDVGGDGREGEDADEVR